MRICKHTLPQSEAFAHLRGAGLRHSLPSRGLGTRPASYLQGPKVYTCYKSTIIARFQDIRHSHSYNTHYPTCGRPLVRMSGCKAAAITAQSANDFLAMLFPRGRKCSRSMSHVQLYSPKILLLITTGWRGSGTRIPPSAHLI